MPSLAAAPDGPETRPRLSASAASMTRIEGRLLDAERLYEKAVEQRTAHEHRRAGAVFPELNGTMSSARSRSGAM